MCSNFRNPAAVNPLRNVGWKDRANKNIAESPRTISIALGILTKLEQGEPAKCLPKISCLMPL